MGAAMIRCRGCGETKPLGEFYESNRSHCKECVKARARVRRWQNIERVRAYDRERGQRPERKEQVKRLYRERTATEEGRAAHAEMQRRWREANELKRAAHVKTSNAIRDGKLTPEPCQVCGTEDNIEAHHEDYHEPLAVTWLCRTCHGARHREINEERRANV